MASMVGIAAPGAPHVLAVVQAGGQGARMDVLTRERAKPALPFAGSYQLIDIALSNLANSGVDDVWVSVQYQASSLDEHLQSGRPWDLDRNIGGYRRMVPEEGRSGESFSSGNASDLYRLSDEIIALGADLVVVVSADQVFRLDVRELVAQHLERGSLATIVTTEVPRTQASRKAVLTLDESGRVTRVEEKPEKPSSGTISAEIVLVDAAALVRTLSELHAELSRCEETSLGDLPEHLLPRLVEQGEVHAFALEGYWKDMGVPSAYLRAHRDLLADKVDTFGDPMWPMRSNQPDRLPARVRPGAEVDASILAAGADIAGTVRRSVLGPDVVVRAGAVVEDSVLFASTVVEKGARVATSVLDTGVRVGRDAEVGELAGRRLEDDDVTLVGRDSMIGRGARLPAGSRLEPGTQV